MKKMNAYVELKDGTEIGPVRVNLEHKMQGERTCKARGIGLDTFEAEVLMSWLATRDTEGPLKGLGYDDWRAQVLDSQMTVDETEAGDVDPTNRDR